MRPAGLAVLLLALAGCRHVRYPESTGDGMCGVPANPLEPADERSTSGYGLVVHVTTRYNESLARAVVWHEHGRDTTNAQGLVVVPPSRTLFVRFIGYCDGWVRLQRASGRYVRVELSEGD